MDSCNPRTRPALPHATPRHSTPPTPTFLCATSVSHTLNARAALTLGKDMVFRDLAQGAYRMRGIAKGQTITVLVIPEVAQLIKRQLARATPDGAPPPASSPSQAQLLQDVSAWLTLNSMRTERVQFDQLCAQNLATIWRQNAWSQLLEGHQHFKVRPECVQGFMQEKLGEAYLSNRLGKATGALEPPPMQPFRNDLIER